MINVRTRTRITHVLARACWWLLVVVHLPALYSVARQCIDAFEMARAGSLMALMATIALFALKACDVSWLRLRGRPRTTYVLFFLAAAIAHPGTLGRMLVYAPAVAGSSVVAHAGVKRIAPRWRQSWREWASRLATPWRLARSERPLYFLAISFNAWYLARRSRCRVPRAPPVEVWPAPMACAV